MIGRLLAMGAVVAAAAAGAGAAVWTKRKAEEDAALEQEMRGAVVERGRASPVDEPPSIPVAAAETVAADGDDLTRVKGIGAIIVGRLHSMNVTTFAQLASWSDEDIERIGAEIKRSPDRIRHEDWVGQAQTLTTD